MRAVSRSSPGSTAQPTHETVARALTALENLEHRGAAGADADTGDGAGILVQTARRVPRARSPGCTCRRAAPTASASASCRSAAARRARARAAARGDRRGRGPDACSAGATCRSTPAARRLARAALRAGRSASSSSARRRELADDPDAFERKLYVIRRVAELAAGPDLVVPSLSARTLVYKGMLTAPQLGRYYPDLGDDALRERARARALALLDEHVPELGARAPVPHDRAQRRDQHAARQRQLDARARVAARIRALRRRPAQGAAGRSGPAAPTRRCSTTCSSCSCSPAARCRTR